MRKWFLPLMVVLVLMLAACGNAQSNATTGTETNGSGSQSGEATTTEASTITYQSENGPVEVPANPQRVVVLDGSAGTLAKLGVPIVGADTWTMSNPNMKPYLGNAKEVSADNLEQIIELKPDLIITSSTTKNIDKLKQLAPLVSFTYNKVDYLTQIEETAKVVNKAEEGAAWVKDFKARATKAGEEIKAKIGADATVSVFEVYGKEMYTFGDAWGRGTEILYQAMGLNMPEKVKEMTKKDGYYTLSAEVLPDYMGDYVFFSKYPDSDTSFESTDTFKNIPAVKNNHLYEVDGRGFTFNDATTLDLQLELIKKDLLGQS
ncbi:iron-hydroxamate ABC transporter substrate-binding protein [Paenibacillus hunanensis]|uniref:iron-hydroxamate ABC transporter substrate-binding protein n=1 Tax=Paenibacillus hunanensis TaxID=539262 RepID=UPI002A6B8F7A|nr:iron-hydroxamate ABC transporter substrate-binding protein [Paenibacillus hunanensis]WPP43091.1 iron-hydroxamate ABC transporter substrate-binding protein [Paenibacillus hunanensis]